MSVLPLEVPELRFRSGGGKIAFNLGDYVRMLLGDVVHLARIGLQIVHLEFAGDAETDGFPTSHAHGLLRAALVELPVEELVLRLLAAGRLFAEEFRRDRDAVEVARRLGAGDFGEWGISC